MKITIIGAGHLGRALATVVQNGVVVELYDKDPSALEKQLSLEQALNSASAVFFAVPSRNLEEALLSCKPHISPDTLIVLLSKGIASESGRFSYQICEQVLPGHNYSLLSGPMLADELIERHLGFGVVAPDNHASFELLRDVFNPKYLKLEKGNDIATIAACGVLKNIYSILIGIALGLEYHKNSIGRLKQLSVAECVTILKSLKLDPTLFYGLAGLADFDATSSSSHSQNVMAGLEIAQGLEPRHSEGLSSLSSVIAKVGEANCPPLLRALESMVTKKQSPATAVAELLG